MSIEQKSQPSDRQDTPACCSPETIVLGAVAAVGVGVLATLGIVAGLYLQRGDGPRAQEGLVAGTLSVPAPAEEKPTVENRPAADERPATLPVVDDVVSEPANLDRAPATREPPAKEDVALAPAFVPAQVGVPKAPAPQKNPAPAVATVPGKDLPQLSATELREQLAKVPEIDFYADVDKLRAQLIDTYAASSAGKNLADATAKEKLFETYSPPVFREKVNDLLLKKARSEGLPLRTGSACRVDLETAKTMGHISTTLRRHGFVSNPVRGTPGRVDELKSWCEETKVEKYPGGASTLLQMLQVEDEPCRLVLVHELAKLSNNPAASAALARMAMFDLSGDVRQACVAVLKQRPAQSYRQELLRGLRYTWAPAADRAAEALVALGDKPAIPSLVKLLDKPDPTLPVLDPRTKSHTVNELVRINHMRNCYLCHAASQAPTPLEMSTAGKASSSTKKLIAYEEPCRGLVPRAGRAIPVAYYADRTGGDFVRADVTYLHQDFSVPQQVGNAYPWPEMQRYDYLVRSRKATSDEVELLELQSAQTSYPQRNAVLYALRKLTGQELGETTEAWQSYLDGGQRGK
jgi:hypothetical protein